MVKESEAIFPYVKKDNGVFVVDSEKGRQDGIKRNSREKSRKWLYYLGQRI